MGTNKEHRWTVTITSPDGDSSTACFEPVENDDPGNCVFAEASLGFALARAVSYFAISEDEFSVVAAMAHAICVAGDLINQCDYAELRSVANKVSEHNDATRAASYSAIRAIINQLSAESPSSSAGSTRSESR